MAQQTSPGNDSVPEQLSGFDRSRARDATKTHVECGEEARRSGPKFEPEIVSMKQPCVGPRNSVATPPAPEALAIAGTRNSSGACAPNPRHALVVLMTAAIDVLEKSDANAVTLGRSYDNNDDDEIPITPPSMTAMKRPEPLPGGSMQVIAVTGPPVEPVVTVAPVHSDHVDAGADAVGLAEGVHVPLQLTAGDGVAVLLLATGSTNAPRPTYTTGVTHGAVPGPSIAPVIRIAVPVVGNVPSTDITFLTYGADQPTGTGSDACPGPSRTTMYQLLGSAVAPTAASDDNTKPGYPPIAAGSPGAAMRYEGEIARALLYPAPEGATKRKTVLPPTVATLNRPTPNGQVQGEPQYEKVANDAHTTDGQAPNEVPVTVTLLVPSAFAMTRLSTLHAALAFAGASVVTPSIVTEAITGGTHWTGFAGVSCACPPATICIV